MNAREKLLAKRRAAFEKNKSAILQGEGTGIAQGDYPAGFKDLKEYNPPLGQNQFIIVDSGHTEDDLQADPYISLYVNWYEKRRLPCAAKSIPRSITEGGKDALLELHNKHRDMWDGPKEDKDVIRKLSHTLAHCAYVIPITQQGDIVPELHAYFLPKKEILGSYDATTDSGKGLLRWVARYPRNNDGKLPLLGIEPVLVTIEKTKTTGAQYPSYEFTSAEIIDDRKVIELTGKKWDDWLDQAAANPLGSRVIFPTYEETVERRDTLLGVIGWDLNGPVDTGTANVDTGTANVGAKASIQIEKTWAGLHNPALLKELDDTSEGALYSFAERNGATDLVDKWSEMNTSVPDANAFADALCEHLNIAKPVTRSKRRVVSKPVVVEESDLD